MKYFDKNKLFNYFLIIYFTIFQLSIFQKTGLMQAFTVILLFVTAILILLKNRRLSLTYLAWILLSIVILLATLINIELTYHSIYRVCVYILIAIFPLTISLLNSSFIYRRVSFFYIILLALVVFDYMIFIIFNTTPYWNVIKYVTYRASGPFFDPNFLGYISGALLLIEYKSLRRSLYLIIFLCSLIVSGSLSAVVILIFILIVFNLLNNTRAIPAILMIYLFLVYILYEYNEVILSISTNFIISESLNFKLISLFNRFDVNYLALDLIISNPLGYGYRSLLEHLPRDTHNSFVGILFEYGVGAFFLILTPYIFLKTKKTYLIFYSFFIALLLNIHYLPFFLMTFITFEKDHENE